MKTGSVKDFAGTTPISNEELLTMECDILIPAALGNQLTGENAGNVKAKWVVEAANGPTTPDAGAILKEKVSWSFQISCQRRRCHCIIF